MLHPIPSGLASEAAMDLFMFLIRISQYACQRSHKIDLVVYAFELNGQKMVLSIGDFVSTGQNKGHISPMGHI